MKKLFYSMFAFAALAMTSTSCSDEIESGVVNSNEAEVSFSVQLESAVGSRAIGDGKTAKYLTFAVFKAEDGKIGEEVEALRQYDIEVQPDLKATVTTRLVKGQTYNFVFWAQSEKVENENGVGTYYDILDMSCIKVNYKNSAIDGNSEKRDAFYAFRKELTVTGPITEEVTLKRPFGQINVGTKIGSLQDAYTAEVEIKTSKVIISQVATELYPYTGAIGGDQPIEVTYSMAKIPEITEQGADYRTDGVGALKNVGGTDYEYLSMNYILVHDDEPGENQVVDGTKKQMLNNVHFAIYDSEDENATPINEFDIPNVPVQRNWRTNIVGDIMNNDVTFNIVIDPSFDDDNQDDDHNYYANVQTADELSEAIAHGAVVTLTTDITTDKEQMSVNKDAVLNLNGKTLTFTKENILFRVNGKLTINGQNGAIVSKGYVASANTNGEIIVNGGNYTSEDVTLFQANGGKVTINGGYYDAQGVYEGKKYVYTLNHIDAQKNNGKIEVTGGVFVGYDPMNSASESPAMNFMAAGYETTKVGNVYVAHEAGQTVVLPQDIKTTEAVVVEAGETFDGNGKLLTMSKGTEEFYIKPKGGTIKNVRIEGYNGRNEDGKLIRGIFIENATENVTIEGVDVKGVAYPLNTGGNIAAGLTLTVKNSTLYGWTSFAAFAEAAFTGVNFKKSGFDFSPTTAPEEWFASVKPYMTTTFTDCTFEEGFTLDLSAFTGTTVTFSNCKVGEKVITAAEVEALLNFTDTNSVVKVQ